MTWAPRFYNNTHNNKIITVALNKCIFIKKQELHFKPKAFILVPGENIPFYELLTNTNFILLTTT